MAQVVAEELGLDPQTIMVEEGDTDAAPYSLGTYASRRRAGQPRRDRDGGAPHPQAKKIAAHLLEVGEADVEWSKTSFRSRACRRRRSR